MNLFPIKLARRYVFSGKNAVEVNVISWIAFLALGFVTTCLLVILSVFSGLEDLNLKFYSDINPDIKIEPNQGKKIDVSDKKLKVLDQIPKITTKSYVIEEKAFISYENKTHIIMLKGVDDNFNHIFRLDTMVKIGEPISYKVPDEITVGVGVSSRLSLYPDQQQPIDIYVPKAGEGIISAEEDAFTHVDAYCKGIFLINEKYEQYVFSNLSLAQKLLNYDKKEVSAIELKTSSKKLDKLADEIQQKIGENYTVKTRQEIDAAFLKMMNTENLIIYLIFVLILIIASFNLAGSVAILILDKKEDAITLKSMGFSNSSLRATYFYTGVSITLYALILGLALGTLISWIQSEFSLVMVSNFVAFPVHFKLSNYLITIFSVMAIGIFVSWFVSRKAVIKIER